MLDKEQLDFWDYYDAMDQAPVEEPKTNYEMIRDFHKAFGLALDEAFNDDNFDLDNFRRNLITEEYEEYMDETFEHPVKVLKELTDLLYVVYGTGASFGWDMDEAFRRVHESNMSKLGEDGKPIRRESDGKVLKGPNYKKPNLDDLV